MKSTFNICFYAKKDKQKANGAYPLFARITVDGVASRFNTKLDVLPSIWDGKMGKATGRTSEASRINRMLDDINASLNTIYHEMQRRDNYVTAEKVKNEFLGHSESHETILTLFQKHNDDVKQLVGISKTIATYRKYEVTRRHLAEFIQSKYNVSDISIKEISPMFITDFELYLRTACKCGYNTTAKFMQFFKRIIIIARNNGILVNDPFASYKIRLEKVDRGYLTEDEIKIILKKKMVSERLEHVRDLFIFACFTGLAYIDVAGLTQDNICKSFDGNLWIMTKRQKTNTDVNVPLLDIPKMILKKYKGKLPNGKILPIISNQKLNAYLKEIANICGIKKNLTFHLARHTFATTTTLSKGVPIETVSKMLGHTNIETTQIYARITNSKIGSDMQGLDKKFVGIEKIYKEVAMKLQIIRNKIFEVRGCRVMLDYHLAELYQVETRALKQAVKRNIERFPSDFMFVLTKEEANLLLSIGVSQNVIPPDYNFGVAMPMAFTEQGVAMLSSVLRSKVAIEVNISIMRAFVLMRQMVIGYEELLRRIEELEVSTDAQFNELYQALTQLLSQSKQQKERRPVGFVTYNRDKDE